MIRPKLVTNKYIRSSDKGHVSFPESRLTHADRPKEVADQLSEEYTKLVEDNPEYHFQILHNESKREITITWQKRE